MHYTDITCITSNYTHSTATSGQIVGFIRTVYAVPRRVLAAKGCITDPDQPCHSTFGPQPSSRGCQLVGPILRCFEPASRVHTTESVAPWIPWAPLWLILQVLMPSKRLRPCEVSRPMSIGKDGLHQFLLHRAQGHAREMLRVEPDVRCYLQHSISLVI